MTSTQAIALAILIAAIAAGGLLAHLFDHIAPHPKDDDDQ